ncbi:MAG: hypothetical protein WA688_01695 [Thermoplasmata archaeon]
MVPPFEIPVGRWVVAQDRFGNSLVLLGLSKGWLKTDAVANVIEP